MTEYIFSDSRGNVYKMDCRDCDHAFQLAYKCGLCCHGSTTNLLRTGQHDLLKAARKPA